MADPSIQAEFREFKERLNKALGYPDENADNWGRLLHTPRNTEMALRILRDPVRLRTLLMGREIFIEYLIESQERAEKSLRDPSRMIEILSLLSPIHRDLRQHRKDLIERTLKLLNGSDFKVELRYSQGFEPEAEIRSSAGHVGLLCTASFRPLSDLFHIDSLSLGSTIAEDLKSAQGQRVPGRVILPIHEIPPPDHVAKNPARLLMLLAHAVSRDPSASTLAGNALKARLSLSNAHLNLEEWSLFFSFYLFGRMSHSGSLPETTWDEIQRLLLEQLPSDFSNLKTRKQIKLISPQGDANSSSRSVYEAFSPESGRILAQFSIGKTEDAIHELRVHVGERQISIDGQNLRTHGEKLSSLMDKLFEGEFSRAQRASDASIQALCAHLLERTKGAKEYPPELPPKR